MKEVIKSYKGFSKGMKCHTKQYEEGCNYEERRAEVCNVGMHACEYPLDCFRYYEPSRSVYHAVEQSGTLSRSDDGTKVASTKMRIGERIDIAGFVKAAIEYTKKHINVTTEHASEAVEAVGEYEAVTVGEYGVVTAGKHGMANAGKYGAATAGQYGVANVGEHGAATAGHLGVSKAGYCGSATAGEYGAAIAGYLGAAAAGYCGVATAGKHGGAVVNKRGVATVGYCGIATAGYRGVAIAGEHGTATSKGKSCSGKNGLSVARGKNVMVKGGVGTVIVIAEEEPGSYKIKDWAAAVVDGEKIKPYTWYMLKDGDFVIADK